MQRGPGRSPWQGKKYKGRNVYIISDHRLYQLAGGEDSIGRGLVGDSEKCRWGPICGGSFFLAQVLIQIWHFCEV